MRAGEGGRGLEGGQRAGRAQQREFAAQPVRAERDAERRAIGQRRVGRGNLGQAFAGGEDLLAQRHVLGRQVAMKASKSVS